MRLNMIWFLNGIHCKIDQKMFKKTENENNREGSGLYCMTRKIKMVLLILKIVKTRKMCFLTMKIPTNEQAHTGAEASN
jgi:hypothetical protein